MSWPGRACTSRRRPSDYGPFSRSLDRLQIVLLDAARDVGTGEVEGLGHGFEEGSRASRLELQIPAGHIRLRVPLIRKDVQLWGTSGSECACRGSSLTQSARGWCRRPSGGSRGVPGGSRGRRRCRFRRREWRLRPGRACGPVGLGAAAGERTPHGWPRRPNGAAERPGASV